MTRPDAVRLWPRTRLLSLTRDEPHRAATRRCRQHDRRGRQCRHVPHEVDHRMDDARRQSPGVEGGQDQRVARSPGPTWRCPARSTKRDHGKIAPVEHHQGRPRPDSLAICRYPDSACVNSLRRRDSSRKSGVVRRGELQRRRAPARGSTPIASTFALQIARRARPCIVELSAVSPETRSSRPVAQLARSRRAKHPKTASRTTSNTSDHGVATGQSKCPARQETRTPAVMPATANATAPPRDWVDQDDRRDEQRQIGGDHPELSRTVSAGNLRRDFSLPCAAVGRPPCRLTPTATRARVPGPTPRSEPKWFRLVNAAIESELSKDRHAGCL